MTKHRKSRLNKDTRVIIYIFYFVNKEKNKNLQIKSGFIFILQIVINNNVAPK